MWINGEPVPTATVARLAHFGSPTRTIAADGGLDAAMAHDVAVDVLIGDLDSVSARAQSAFGGVVLEHRPDKDFTDLELALEHALEIGATEVTVVGGGGGRLDHELSSVLLLASDRYRSVRLRALLGDSIVTVVRPEFQYQVTPPLHGELSGSRLSLLPVGGSATGVHAQGVQWPLNKESLAPGEARGMSNVIQSNATVSIEGGVLLAIQSPG